MVSLRHETLVELFRNRPGFAAVLVEEVLGIALPPFTSVRAESLEFNQIKPAEYRCDHVVVLDAEGQQPVAAIAVEIQLGDDARKRFSWPVYAAELRSRLGCPTTVLAVCPTDALARWANEPIELGFGNTFRPLVLGPSSIPVVTDPERAKRTPELAVLSAQAHGQGDPETAAQIASACDIATRDLDADVRGLYLDMVLAALPEAVRKAFAMIPQGYQWQSEPAQRAHRKGRAESILDVLDARGVAVSDAERERIVGCRDLAQLERWIRRAATASSATELFVE